jgi:hypothetical protein
MAAIWRDALVEVGEASDRSLACSVLLSLRGWCERGVLGAEAINTSYLVHK